VRKKFVALLALVAGFSAIKRVKARRTEEELWNSAAKTPPEK